MPSDDHGKIKKSRQRASIACHGCRERRTRCVMLAGSAICMHCSETGQECIVKQDDRRRKPVSKAYVNVLQRRIQELETALGGGSPQDQHQAVQETPSVHRVSIPSPILQPSNKSPITIPSHCDRSVEQQKPSVIEGTSPTSDGRRGDRPSGRRLRGPTAGHHIKWHQWIQATPDEETSRAMEKRERRAQRVLADICLETQNYLMGLFWQHYNAIIRVVHRDAFEEGQRSGERAYYSCFLHICMLAVGYRYADKKHPTIARIAHPSRENTLHREAKDMVAYEMEHPGGIPSIAGLLLLADLEGGCGRDDVGWLYVGVAIRLCFDIGLDRKPDQAESSPQEMEIRRTTLRACVLYDRYWSLFLGRPLALKLDNLEAYQVSKTVDLLRSRQLPKQDLCWETRIYEALLQLMELAGQIAEILEAMGSDKCQLPHQQYFHLAALDHELSVWYSQLPATLQYTRNNVRTAPLSFFHLHQQYYSVMIMLHSELGKCSTESPSPTAGTTGYHLALLSQVTCTTSAGRMAQIFSQQRQRFHINQMFSTGLQHAGSAASVLVTALESSKENKSWATNKKYLDCIFDAVEEMSTVYEAAERMVPVLDSIIRELTPTERHPLRSIKRGQGSTDTDENLRTNMSSQALFGMDCDNNLAGHLSSLTPDIAESISFDTHSPSSLPSLWGGPDAVAFPQASDLNLPNFDIDLPTPPMAMGEGYSVPSFYEAWTGDPTAITREVSGPNGISRDPINNPKSHAGPIGQGLELLGLAQGGWSEFSH